VACTERKVLNVSSSETHGRSRLLLMMSEVSENISDDDNAYMFGAPFHIMLLCSMEIPDFSADINETGKI